MDLIKEVRDDWKSSFEIGMNRIEAELKKRLKKQSDEFERSQATLNAELAGLRAQIATLDEILAENHRLRANWVAQSAQYGYHHGITKDDHVHRALYRSLLVKYQESVSSLHSANQLGKKYRDETKVLHERRQRDKKAIRTWQEYHDRLMSKKGNAHHDLQDLIIAIESPPSFQAERQGLDGNMSHIMSDMTSPPRTAVGTEDRLMTTPAPTLVAGQPRTESPRQMSTAKQGGQVQLPEILEEVADLIDSGVDRLQDQGPAYENHGDDPKEGLLSSMHPESVESVRLMAATLSRPPQPARGPVIRSSQSTDGEDDLSPRKSPIKKDPSAMAQSDEPEVISIRSTKRKRTESRANSKRSKGEIVLIKSELGSSPIHDSALNHLNQTESVDLDEVTVAFTTPQKRMRMSRRSLELAPRGEEPAFHRHQSLPPAIERHLSAGSRGGSDLSDSQRESICSHGHVNTELQKRPVRSRVTGHDDAEPQPEHSTTALRCLDLNMPLTPRSERFKSTSSKRRRGSRGVVIQDFAEDGEQYSRRFMDQPTRPEDSASPSTIKPLIPMPKRLNALLEVPSSSDRKLLTPASKLSTGNGRPAATFHSRTDVLLSLPGPSENPRKVGLEEPAQRATWSTHLRDIAPSPRVESPVSVGRARLRNFDKLEALISPINAATTTTQSKIPLEPRLARATNIKRQVIANKAPPVTPQTGKLKTPATRLRSPASHEQFRTPDSIRNRPISELKPHDFQINTEANFGHDHAFTDVVRNHDDRRCLPGCTKPDCCGEHFRKMVELGGLKPAPRGIFEPTSSQEGTDERSLREYMGHNAGVIPSLSEQGKEELLAKARTEQLSKQVSRHRAQWERPKSPPGFWKTDFPTTQEAAGYKSEAGRRETADVLERRREAMRPGGKWKFVDE